MHPNPGPPRYPCSVCFKNVTSQGTSYLCTRCSHWVHSRCSGLRNVADYRRTNGWICTACRMPPIPSPPPSPAHTPTMSEKTFNILQWNANDIGNKQTKLIIFLEAHNVKVSQHPELHPSTTGSTPRPRSRFTVFLSITQSEELTISIAMDNTELLITNVYIPRPVPAMGVIHHHSTTC